MFPFRDNIPSRTFPFVNTFLILANVVVFIYEISLGRGVETLFWRFGVVPQASAHWSVSDAPVSALALPYFTSMFLHGGILHLLGNMWYLWIFGDNVEDRIGHVKYVLFYLLCGIVAGVTHTTLNPSSDIPSIGASGAVAGVLGAYLVSYPFARVSTIIPIIFFIQIVEIPAVIVLSVWFLMQFLGASGGEAAGIAWWAHIGGFVAGIGLLFVLARRPRQPYGYS